MKTKKARRPFRMFAILRVLFALTLILSTSAFALFHVSKARAGDVLVQLGAQLMRLPDAYYPNTVQRLSLNGLDLRLQSGSSARPPEEVVQQFYDACKSRSAVQLDERQREGISSYLAESNWFQHAVDGVMVQRSSEGASVVCIDAEGKPWNIESIVEAAQRFVETGELAELGRLRYAWVKAGQSGSVFLTLWTEGPARLLEQFPREGDAPGVDFLDVARVPGSQRYLSARLLESQLAVYRHVEGDLDGLAASYRRALEAAGYASVGKEVREEGKRAESYEKARRHVLMTLSEAQRGSVMVTLLSQP